MRGRWSLAIAGSILILAGGLAGPPDADLRRHPDPGRPLQGRQGQHHERAALCPYAMRGAKTPAPGILAVHGYINSRETQDGFAIEFARRGYVVLALDQTGHGYSAPPAFANGFGGPDGLTYLRSLPFVDKANIGLEGHSMGGWTVLAAATAMPNDYKSMVLEGSSTGKPFAADGTPSWPRNAALVFASIRGILDPDVGRGARPGRHQKPKTLGAVRDPGAGRTRQGLWRHRAGHGAGALHPRDHPSGRAHFP